MLSHCPSYPPAAEAFLEDSLQALRSGHMTMKTCMQEAGAQTDSDPVDHCRGPPCTPDPSPIIDMSRTVTIVGIFTVFIPWSPQLQDIISQVI